MPNAIIGSLKRIVRTIRKNPDTLRYKRLWEETSSCIDMLEIAQTYILTTDEHSFNPSVLSGYLKDFLQDVKRALVVLGNFKQYHKDSLQMYKSHRDESLRMVASKEIEKIGKTISNALNFWTFDHLKYREQLQSVLPMTESLIRMLSSSGSRRDRKMTLNRHNDGVVDGMISVVKKKYDEIKKDLRAFSGIPAVKKIIVVCANLVRILSTISALRSAVEIKRAIQSANKTIRSLESLNADLIDIDAKTGEVLNVENGLSSTKKNAIRIAKAAIPSFLMISKLVIASVAKRISNNILNQHVTYERI